MRKVLGFLIAALFSGMAWAGGYPLFMELKKEEDGIWSVIAHNRGKAPVFVQIELKNQKNARIAPIYASGQKALEPGAREPITMVVPLRAEEPVSFDFEYRWVFGRGLYRAEHEGIYRPPFPADMTFDTNNSAGDVHLGTRMQHAVDILMPEGTPVIAARSGVVMDVRGQAEGDKVKDGGQPFYLSESEERMGNYVRLMHSDGTWAEYLHLKSESVRVGVGEAVEAGTQIAESGATGAVNRPHLHFVVLKPGTGMSEPASVPIKMDMPGRGAVLVKPGEAIGAAQSVKIEAALTRHDPLVIAPVNERKADNERGVYSVRAIYERMTTAQLTGLVVGLAVLLASLAGGVIWWRMKRLREHHEEHGIADGRGFVARLRDATRLKRRQQPIGALPVSRPKGDLHWRRPMPGMLFAEWEKQYVVSVSTAMPAGYELAAKVSLNALLPRPLELRSSPQAYATLRGEALDLAIIRERDQKVMVAIELPNEETATIDGQEEVDELKRQMLRAGGIEWMTLEKDEGVESIARRLAWLELGHLTVLGPRPAQARV